MAGLCRPFNALVNCRGNVNKGQYCEKPRKVNCGTAQLVTHGPFESFAVSVGVMTLGASNADDGETDALSHCIGDDAGYFHKALLS